MSHYSAKVTQKTESSTDQINDHYTIMNELYMLLLESIENMVPFNTYKQLSSPRPAEITPICITPAICNLAMVAISL